MKAPDLGTQLCIAVSDADLQKVTQLIAEGADVNAVGDRRYSIVSHRTPLWLAVTTTATFSSEAWNDLAVALAEAFPKRPRLDGVGKRHRLIQILEILLCAKANPDACSYGTTPLAQATNAADLEMVRLLLSKGANPNAESFSILSKLAKQQRVKGPLGAMGYYDTALHSAVEKNSLAIVQALLAAGADPARANHENKTPLDIAREKGFEEIVQMLSKACSRS